MTTPIHKGEGTTPSERYLASLANRTFLNLWSYPNVFIDKKQNDKGGGKELCDLLVVCGDDVIVFSDKSIEWPSGDDIDLAWRRWYKRAVKKSVDQIRGAQRWIEQFPDRIFLDQLCTQKLPLALPPPERRRFHGIVVALGAGAACRKHFNEGTGSLLITHAIKGDAHYAGESVLPFTIGDVNPGGSFIHVLDDASLDVVMSELDTVTDLTSYLNKKERLIRGGQLVAAYGEEELVAYYMTHMNSDDEHDFSRPDGGTLGPNQFLSIDGGHYAGMRRNPRYIARKRIERNSYVWDSLIEAFTKHMLAGTTVLPSGEEFDLATHGDEGVRRMAMVPRYIRRLYGEAILGALQKGSTADRFTRGMLPAPSSTDRETGFFFMTLAVPKIELEGGYEQYRRVRVSMLETYALTFLEKYPALRRVVGIASEPPPLPGAASEGSSEDMIYAEAPEWTDDLRSQLQESRDHYAIAREGVYGEYEVHSTEWPEVVPTDIDEPSKLTKRQKRRLRGKSKSTKKAG